jgi:hypothetical protein
MENEDKVGFSKLAEEYPNLAFTVTLEKANCC